MAQQAENSDLDYCSSGIRHLDRFAEPRTLGLKAEETTDDVPSAASIKTSYRLAMELADIRARRWVLTPVKAAHMEKLLAMGLIEIMADEPVLASTGLSAVA